MEKIFFENLLLANKIFIHFENLPQFHSAIIQGLQYHGCTAAADRLPVIQYYEVRIYSGLCFLHHLFV